MQRERVCHEADLAQLRLELTRLRRDLLEASQALPEIQRRIGALEEAALAGQQHPLVEQCVTRDCRKHHSAHVTGIAATL